ncbi:TSUP family transporter [Noviherbaspirillum sp. L7-7A]|nr:TSUP family transporter [Noviherbaspirillum sp. L7-7A]
MGLPTVAMSVLGLLMGTPEAVALLTFSILVKNTWQLLAGPGFGRLLRHFAPLLATLAAGGFLGSTTLAHASFAGDILGAVLAVYGLFGLLAPQFHVPPRLAPPLAPVGGLLSGLLYGFTGLAVIPLIPYMASLKLDKEELIQAFGLAFSACAIGLTLGRMMGGRMLMSVTLSALLALLPAMAGMMLGQRIRHRMQPDVFRRFFLIWMPAIGSMMLVKAVL